jgi:hypothetical protein
VLLVWVAFAVGLFIYFDNGITFHAAPTPVPAAQAANDDELYTGSIVIVPPSGDECWQMMLDNRTGRMWESGYIGCDAVAGVLAESQRDTKARTGRLNAIGAFFHAGN